MFFVAMFVAYFLVRKFLFLPEGANIVRAMGILGFIASGLFDLQKGISFVFWLITLYLFVFMQNGERSQKGFHQSGWA